MIVFNSKEQIPHSCKMQLEFQNEIIDIFLVDNIGACNR